MKAAIHLYPTSHFIYCRRSHASARRSGLLLACLSQCCYGRSYQYGNRPIVIHWLLLCRADLGSAGWLRASGLRLIADL
jgi:hypothetical protein